MTDAWERLARAEDAYFAGAHEDAVGMSRELLRDLGSAGKDHSATALRVRAIHLQLCASERWWRDPAGPGDVPVAQLIALAAAAAERDGDPVLRALVHHVRGKHLIATRSLTEAIGELAEAVRLAGEGGDVVVELDVLTEFGHHTAGRDLTRAMCHLLDAEALLARSPLRPGERAYHVRAGKLAGFIGVAHFDAGDFDAGEHYLRAALVDLEAAGIVDQHAMIANYLAQLLICTGRYAEAAEILGAALARTGDDAGASMPIGYNLALLGKLHLESGDPAAAEHPLYDGWSHVQGSQHASVRPIVRNYLAELLSDPGYARRDTATADKLLADSVEDCRASGFQRSEVAALSLRGKLRADQGDLTTAVALSTEANDRLDATGALPALRSEEVYLVHHQVLTAAGRPEDARDALRKAWQILEAKSATIADPRHRHTFRTNVRVSAEIEAAARDTGLREATDL